MTNPTRLPADGLFVGRARTSEASYPLVVTVRDGEVIDITSSAAPTVRDLCELEDPAGYLRSAKGKAIGALEDIAANSFEAKRDTKKPILLSPVDLQAVKASGVTFVVSLLERVIEEQARGSAEKADAIRADIAGLIGHDLSKLKPGSPEAMEIKAKLISRGAWSQYLEVGIGPDAEIFTKCQPMASVGFGADVGLHPVSTWNNPEPEIAMIAESSGRIVGATLGNDVNLRDVEGRSALLLGKAKDNNASSAIGPFIRLFDATYSIDDVRNADLSLTITGPDGFVLNGSSTMREISRDPLDLVSQTIGRHHQYPDGFMLFMGTLFAPVEDRDAPGQGFTHKIGDVVTIANPHLGSLTNTVRLSTECPPWTFGPAALMRNLAARGLL